MCSKGQIPKNKGAQEEPNRIFVLRKRGEISGQELTAAISSIRREEPVRALGRELSSIGLEEALGCRPRASFQPSSPSALSRDVAGYRRARSRHSDANVGGVGAYTVYHCARHET